ncbi:hypothetical protein BL250_17715 [Erwinia sp. OLTSP20]|uniref:type 4b pilus protein PilO2 n=1 Tax=unclassified Erwinia TaxID=2622719 RepID=UPI000C18951C|nr:MULTISPECIES: type 4b pilus protein PilO2 [unclassified Erwinia]PIJ49840.1 hypothetical protein BV501_11690 [Erwinia sp. OAMSP11]PIJ70939.1 hypothetical protein BK416_12880 [Erwinia sp. OLSSP12]PIJ80305.1 hypothetical protein BLD47_11745 [Erwinia sp. OLCASP19]PIJ82429.1 hypothetical protein BLD46_11495 [Erwinia sp. OLMTSP26]PIJ85114.1 hypothetical protein BLD49_11605 [Erwinia sp. OLMDSP33]
MSAFFKQETGTVTCNKKKYAVNLIWNLANSAKEFKQTFREEAEQLGVTLYCSFKLADGGICYGLADSAMEHKTGMLVLPAMLAPCFDESILGVWRLEEDYWYIFGKDDSGTIVIDKVVEGETEAHESFTTSLRDLKWNKTSYPVSWNFSEHNENFQLEDIPKKNNIRIKGVKFKPEKMHLLALAFIVIASGIAYKFIFAEKTPEPVVQNTPKVIHKHNFFPGSTALLPEQLVNAFRQKIYSNYGLAYSVPGFLSVDSVFSDKNDIVFMLKRDFGSSDYLNKSVMQPIDNAKGELKIVNRQNAMLVFHLAGDGIGDISKLENINDLSDRMQLIFDNTMLPVSLTSVYSCGPRSTDQVKYDRQFSCFDFNFDFNYNPEIIIPIFQRFNSLVINKITFDQSQQKWNFKGTVFGVSGKNG